MNRPLAAGLGIVASLGLVALAAPALTGSRLLLSPLAVNLDEQFQPPSDRHWLGTDDLGRDVLSRLVHGGRPSLTVALVATLVALVLGVPSGSLAGLRGGWWDLILTRLMEATSALPALPLLLVIASMTTGSGRGGGSGTIVLLAAAIGATRWATIARYVRGGVFRVRTEEYAVAAAALGASRLRLLSRHLLPGALTPALVSAAFGAGSAILAESALSFLGLGTQTPLPSWGRMVASAARAPGSWWLIAPPGAAIALVVLGFNLTAEGLRLRAGRGRDVNQGFAGFRLPER